MHLTQSTRLIRYFSGSILNGELIGLTDQHTMLAWAIWTVFLFILLFSNWVICLGRRSWNLVYNSFSRPPKVQGLSGTFSHVRCPHLFASDLCIENSRHWRQMMRLDFTVHPIDTYHPIILFSQGLVVSDWGFDRGTSLPPGYDRLHIASPSFTFFLMRKALIQLQAISPADLGFLRLSRPLRRQTSDGFTVHYIYKDWANFTGSKSCRIEMPGCLLFLTDRPQTASPSIISDAG